MIGVYVSVPIACFRKGLAREYLETELIPPPATCYGFLLSMVGETVRDRHQGVRIAPMILEDADLSVVLRTVWRVKKKPLGSSGNTRPDYQQLLSNVKVIIWLDSSEEGDDEPTLEDRVLKALNPSNRSEISRFGGLSLGESTHMVDEVYLLNEERIKQLNPSRIRQYRLSPQGLLGLPVWVDHVGSAGTVHVVGELAEVDRIDQPEIESMPKIVSYAESE